MDNYEYIIASLPELLHDGRQSSGLVEEDVVREIKALCSDKDRDLVDLLMRGLSPQDEAEANARFYLQALSHRDRFIREYFAFDLMVRNAKARYINRALGREPGTDVLEVAGAPEDDDRLATVESALAGQDLVTREKAIDDAYWAMSEQAVQTQVFSIDVILSFITRLHIVCRWLSLDEQSGREMFRSLVDGVRGTYQGVQYKAK